MRTHGAQNSAERKNHKWLIFKLALGEHRVTMQIEIHSLKNPMAARDAIASPLEHFDFIVESLHESAGLSLDKIVGDFFHVPFERFQEAIKACELAIDYTAHPPSDFSFALAFR